MTTTRETVLKPCPQDCGVEFVRIMAASATCHWVECDCGWTGPKRANKKRAAEVWNAARPAPQPAADTRVVTVLELNHLANTAAECGLSVMAETIRAIIGTATPAQSDKIAEAARIAGKALRYEIDNPGAHPLNVTAVFRDAMRALAGQGETP